jgi:hypothetical protein
VTTEISIPHIVNLVSKKEVKLYFFDRLNVANNLLAKGIERIGAAFASPS